MQLDHRKETINIQYLIFNVHAITVSTNIGSAKTTSTDSGAAEPEKGAWVRIFLKSLKFFSG